MAGARRLEDRVFRTRWGEWIGLADAAERGIEISFGMTSMLTVVGRRVSLLHVSRKFMIEMAEWHTFGTRAC
jgi:hypothetical protein